jgi:hypothetical protein
MFSRLREHFGTAGLVIAIVALVAALGGGAYAATGGSGGGKATASAKGKPGPRGKTGKTGPAGPAGPTGPAGAQGPAGAKGDSGSPGANGQGAETVSFTGVKQIGSVKCEEGGVEVKSASATTVVCNGKKGTNGQTGFTDVLPPGKTETGAWALGELTASGSGGFYRVPISFPIKLAAEIPSTNVHYINVAGKEIEDLEGTEAATASTKCTGNAAAPTATAGHLCIYEGSLENAFIGPQSIEKLDGNGAGASVAGASVGAFKTTSGSRGYGSWAVTAEQ